MQKNKAFHLFVGQNKEKLNLSPVDDLTQSSTGLKICKVYSMTVRCA